MRKPTLTSQKVTEFLQLPDGEQLIFYLPLTKENARKFVRSMSVCLSRRRQMVKKRNRSVKPITMEVVDIAFESETNQSKIILRKKTNNSKLNDEMNDIFESLDNGALVK